MGKVTKNGMTTIKWLTEPTWPGKILMQGVGTRTWATSHPGLPPMTPIGEIQAWLKQNAPPSGPIKIDSLPKCGGATHSTQLDPNTAFAFKMRFW